MKTKKNRWWLGATALLFVAVAVGCIAVQPRPAQPSCSVRCVTPPPGCRYQGQIATGPCDRVTCGNLVCEPTCSILCVAPPPGCHYEGMQTTGPCSEVTCGKLVCGGARGGTSR